jgi:hypothetical protein
MKLHRIRILRGIAVIASLGLSFSVSGNESNSHSSSLEVRSGMVIPDTIPAQQQIPDQKPPPTSQQPTAGATSTVDQKTEAVKTDAAAIIKTVPKARRQVKPVALPKVIQPKPVRIIKPKIVVKPGLL